MKFPMPSPTNKDQIKLFKLYFIVGLLANSGLVALFLHFQLSIPLLCTLPVFALLIDRFYSLEALSTSDLEKLERATYQHPKVRGIISEILTAQGNVLRFQHSEIMKQLLISRRERVNRILTSPLLMESDAREININDTIEPQYTDPHIEDSNNQHQITN